jgi:hypothetical protein
MQRLQNLLPKPMRQNSTPRMAVADIVSPEARRLNDGRDTMEIEVGGEAVRKAAAKEKAGKAKDKDEAEKEEHLRDEAGREKGTERTESSSKS